MSPSILACSLSLLAALPGGKEKLIDLLEARERAVYAYEVHLDVTAKRLYKTPGMPDHRDIFESNGKLPKTTFIPLSSQEIDVQREHLVEYFERQSRFFGGQSRLDLAKRRADFFAGPDESLVSKFAFDGQFRWSYYPGQSSGLVGGPPKELKISSNIGRDYLEILGLLYAGQSLRSVLERSEDVEFGESNETTVKAIAISRKTIPCKVTSLTFNKAHGFSITAIEVQWFYPSELNGKVYGGDDVRHTVYEMQVQRERQIGGGVWVPVDAVVKQFHVKWNAEQKAATSFGLYDVAISVDENESRWNTAIDDSVFSFDFPAGSHVYNELLNVHLTIGDQEAGRHIDKLLSQAQKVVPSDYQGIQYAKNWPYETQAEDLANGSVFTPGRVALVAGNALLLIILVSLVVVKVRRGGSRL